GFQAPGMAVRFTGSTTAAHFGGFWVGSGSFTFVRVFSSDTTATTIDSTTNLAQLGLAGLSYGGSTNWRDFNGIQINGSDDVGLQGLGVSYGGAVTITGVTAASAAGRLRYIEGAGISVTSASGFSGRLLLNGRASPVTLGANLTTVGRLAIYGSGLSLTGPVTTSGGAVTINLGAAGVYNNGAAGYSLNTSGNSLSITAASISNTTATNPIFRLGTGTLTLGGGLVRATVGTDSSTQSYTSSYITSKTIEAKFNTEGVAYYFSSNVATADSALTTAGLSNFFVLGAAALNATDLGYKTITSSSVTYTTGGLAERATGDFHWGDSTQPYTDNTHRVVTFRLADGHEVNFYGLTNPAMPATTPSWLSTSTSITFHGANSFNSGLSLASAGAISQATGATLSVTGGNLVVTGSTAITLTNTGNALGNLGGMASTGAISITTTSGGITLSGAVISGGGDLTLSAAGTITQATGSTLNLNGGKLIVSSSTAITLNNSGNHIGTLGGLISSGAIAITNDSRLILNNFTGAAGGTMTITVNKDAGLTLASNANSIGGAVTLNLCKGSYDSRNVTASYKWATTNQNLSLTAGDIKAGSGAVFELGSGTLTPTIASFSTPAFGTNLYFSNDRSINANNIKDVTNDPTAEYHSLGDLNDGLVAGGVFKDTTSSAVSNTGTLRLESNRVFAADTAGTTITFWNVRNGDVTARLNVKEIRFGGAQNSFSRFEHDVATAGGERAAMRILAGSVLRGNIKIGSAGLT
ncbi:MAG: hypothetical protein ORO03_09025, partial [Alphaproteobacteria bacterium]|nr:hypothetical protein [Alphaproteobacteria bacterium]